MLKTALPVVLLVALAPLAAAGGSGESLQSVELREVERRANPDGGEIVRYTATVDLAGGEGDGATALVVPAFDLPYTLRVNGILLARYGRWQERYNSTSYRGAVVPLDAALVAPASDTVDMTVYPRGEATPVPALRYGSFLDASRDSFWRGLFGSTIITASSIVALVVFAYFMFLFVTDPRRDRAYLYFSLVGLSFSLAYWEINYQWSSGPEVLVKQVSKIGFALTLGFFFIFLTHFTGYFRTRNRWVRWLAIGGAGLFVALFALADSKAAVDVVFGYANLTYFAPMLLFSLVMVTVAALRDKLREAWILVVAEVAVLAAALHDIMWVVAIPGTPYVYLTAYGFMVLVIAVMFMLAFRQARARRESIERAAELGERTETQRRMLESIGDAVEAVTRGTAILEQSVEGSVGLLQQQLQRTGEVRGSLSERIDALRTQAEALERRVRESIDRVPRALAGQAEAVRAVAAALGEVRSASDRVFGASERTGETVTTLEEVSAGARRTANESRRSLEELSGYSRVIREVLVAIRDITERTHVLSINAAIEAARAGETGRGFMTVAKEIRSLSEGSKRELESSFSRIEEMQRTIEASADHGATLDAGVDRIVEAIEHTGAVAREITDGVAAQRRQTAEIDRRLGELVAGTESLTAITDETREADSRLLETLTSVQGFLADIATFVQTEAEAYDTLRGSLETIQREVGRNAGEVQSLAESVEA